MKEKFLIRSTSRTTPPRISFEKIYIKILGNNFSLSLVFIGDTLAKKLNKKYRGKTYSANVLTFPLTRHSGEIFINLYRAKKESAQYGISYKKWVLQLFIHGILHLEGMPHGATMEKAEQRLLKKFS